MGRIGITYQEVAKAISTLQSQQKNPTVDHIREILGTGSKSTIARFLREWKSKNGLQNDDDGALPSDLINLVKGLWGALQEKADNQSAQSIKECDEKIAQMQQQLNGYRQSQSEISAKIHTLEEQNHQKTEEINALKQALNTEQHEKIKITERATNLESNKGQAQDEIERLHQLLKHVQDNLEHYQMATQQLRQEQALLIEKQRSEYEQKISQLQNQIELIFSEKTNYQVQYIQLNKTHDKLEIDHKALILQHNDMLQKHSMLKASHEKTQKDYEQLVTTHQQQSQNLEGKHHTVIELQLKLNAGDEKIIALEKELSKANDKVNALRHDHQFTAQEKANLEGQLKQFQSS
jgi:chromosome segregation ATPase